MNVLKFGGSSVGSAESILQVLQIIGEQKNSQSIVVLSAFQGMTDELINCATLASTNQSLYTESLLKIENRHIEMIKALLPTQRQSDVLEAIKVIFKELKELLHGIYLLKEATPRTMDSILSFGERLSSYIATKVAQDKGLDATLSDARDFIKTNFDYGNAVVDFKETTKKVKQHFKAVSNISIVPGFISSAPDGSTSTLGRGGSDYTASLLAGMLKADSLEIWTDVDGMLTASPLKVSSAMPIKELSYEEAMELSHFGAKVLYAPTIQPVMDANIALKIKNTFNPNAPGTVIKKKVVSNGHLITGLSSIEGVALLTLSGSGMVGIPGFAQRMFGALSLQSVNVILITQASSEHSITIVIEEKDIRVAVDSLQNEFAYEMSLHKVNPIEVKENKAIIALVGDNMQKYIGIAGRAFSVLGQNGVNVNAIAQGSTERNISIVMDTKDVKKSLNVLHEKFFLSHLKKINLYIIGIGGVGGELLRQIDEQQEFLQKEHHVELRVIGVANSKKMLFDQSGIALKKYKDQLLKKGEKMGVDDFLLKMKGDNLRNSIFIDNTSSEEIAKSYKSILENSISVVTPNKIAASLSHGYYMGLKKQARKSNVKFLYETNVGAGLPVINTMADLVKSGDEILKIEAVLSGSLNFIFNRFVAEKISFREIVEIAMKEGYTEPDPRIDLSGVDVKRKLLILARESGMPVEMKDVKGSNFLPKGCQKTDSVADFLESISSNQSYFEQLKNDAVAVNGKLRYIAKLEEGKLEAGLQTVGEDHPFYRLNGTDNILLLTTKRYNKFPMVIQGAGAGTEVTAAGVFSDIMRIANR